MLLLLFQQALIILPFYYERNLGFMAVHLVASYGVTQINNLSPPRSHILNFFSPACQRYYLLLAPVSDSKFRTNLSLDFL